jgi:type II secretory pathway pseudopilin PulG
VNSIRTAVVRRLRSSDEGISLVEVMIAMIIFSIVSLGVIGTLIATANFAVDSRARETATNLASQAIDTAMATPDVFSLFSTPNVVTPVDGRNYTVNTVAQWVSNSSSVLPCGGGGGALLYKRVNVTVTWPGMMNPGSPVEQDTLIAPTERVSDPDDATILVSVKDQKNNPVSGVTVTTTPALNPPAAATDVDGCTYLLKVPVGTYTITVKKAGYVGTNQVATQSKPVSVTAGQSVSWGPSLAQAQPLALNYASNYAGSPAPLLPSGMYTSLLHATDLTVNASALPPPLSLYPFADGYSVFAGNFVAQVAGSPGTPGCLSPNQALWPSTTVSGTTYSSPANQIVVPGVDPAANIRMGIMQVTGSATGSQSVSAVVQAAGPSGSADPGCSSLAGTIYNFGSILSNKNTKTIALPFGTYKLFYTATGTGTQISTANMTVTAPSINNGNIVTLDPRVAG